MYVPDHSDVTISWVWGCEGSGDTGENKSIMVHIRHFMEVSAGNREEIKEGMIHRLSLERGDHETNEHNKTETHREQMSGFHWTGAK